MSFQIHNPTFGEIRAKLDNLVPAMLLDLERFVNIESPSGEISCLQQSAEFLSDLFLRVTGRKPQIIPGANGPHVHWRGSNHTNVLIVGHHDTVFPKGTVASRPFGVVDGVAKGPGVFDMKTGILQAIYGLASVPDSYHCEVLITADEEIGSESSRALIEQRAMETGAVIVIEPSADNGALKIARKGCGTFTVQIDGRASHAGLEPEKGINSLVEMSLQVAKIVAMARPDLGTTVTPTIASAGSAENVVPEKAVLKVDVRVSSIEEQDRIESEMKALTSQISGAKLTVSGSINRPPMPESVGGALFGIATMVAANMGMAELIGVAVGGGSDGNFTAALGVPTLDGMGAVGGGAHSIDEHVVVATIGERAALLAGVARALVNR